MIKKERVVKEKKRAPQCHNQPFLAQDNLLDLRSGPAGNGEDRAVLVSEGSLRTRRIRRKGTSVFNS